MTKYTITFTDKKAYNKLNFALKELIKLSDGTVSSHDTLIRAYRFLSSKIDHNITRYWNSGEYVIALLVKDDIEFDMDLVFTQIMNDEPVGVHDIGVICALIGGLKVDAEISIVNYDEVEMAKIRMRRFVDELK